LANEIPKDRLVQSKKERARSPPQKLIGALLVALCGDQTKSNLGRQQQDRRLSPSLFGNVGGKVLGFLAAQ
jgi:hypothetical protein